MKHALALAALDLESDVTEVNLTSGIDELKRRLEVLIGKQPDAAMDESQKSVVEEEAERLARKKRAALAGGNMVTAAFNFLGEMFPRANGWKSI